MENRTIIHIYLDSFFVSVEQVLNPELKGKPVVVGGKPGRRGVVATASYEARAFGLHSGMPIVTSARLCPQAIFLEGDFSRYYEYSRKFMAILNDFSPFIEPMDTGSGETGGTVDRHRCIEPGGRKLSGHAIRSLLSEVRESEQSH